MTKKMGLLIPILLLGSMYGSIWRDEIKTNASNDDTNEREQSMATFWTLDSVVSIAVNSGGNEPFCYTYPDGPSTTASKNKITLVLRYFNASTSTYRNRTYNSSSTPSISTVLSTTTSYNTNGTYNLAYTFDVDYTLGTDNYTAAGSASVSVDVYQNEPVSMAWNSGDNHRTVYNRGEYFTPDDDDDMLVDITWTAGSEIAKQVSINPTQIQFPQYFYHNPRYEMPIAFGTTSFTLGYHDTATLTNITLSYSVTVTDICDYFSISKQPSKEDYEHGDTLDFDGIEISRFYKIGTTSVQETTTYNNISGGLTAIEQMVADGFTLKWQSDDSTVSSPYLAHHGKGDIYLTWLNTTYTGTSTYTSINEVDLTITRVLSSISITTPTKTTYKVGEKLDMTGFALTATYADGGSETISSGYRFNTDYEHIMLLAEVGTKTITVTYGGKTASFDITITKFYSSFAITKQPTDIYYKHGETLDMSGMQISLYASTGEYETVSVTNTAWLASNGYALRWLYDDEVATTAIYHWGDLYLTYSHATYTGGATYNSTNEIDITVYHEVASIAVRTMPTKTTFNVNDTFDTSGLEINATYNDGTTSQVIGFYTNPTSGSKLTNAQLGTLSVTVDYIENGVMVSTSFNVTVLASVQLTSITVKTLPTKAIYKQGEAFVSTGLVITANYNNSTTVDLTTGFTLNPNDGYIFTNDDKVAGSKSIVVSLTDYDDEITKTVSFAVSISTTATLTSVQTPVTYVDEYGELDELYVRFITPNTLSNGEPYINFPYLTEAYWNATTGLKVQIDESSYSKSGFEVPWMGYAVQFGNANDIVIGDNLVHRFLPESGTVDTYADKSTVMRYVWIISTIPITEDNAESLSLPVKSDYYDTATSKFISTANNTCFLTVSSNTLSIAFKSSSLYHNDVYQSSVNNSTQLQGKHIAVFAVQYGKLKSVANTTPTSIASVKKQFLFGLNYIPSSATATLTLTVNGWKLY